ncbi:hypothetical protein Ddye_013135 [Dipteronia dyeriana]|uniref:MCM C-terminal AAA(+) ATPase domain-containing protein n=1 Tax=Dipteronia dyeriana TaxID=168575 RepID=A0AAD9X5Q6_9ROSI|nr:hypothetical protein Ddye_013135 [Dipteronia dyeriana]
MRSGGGGRRLLFADKQILRLQETPDDIPEGGTPHIVSLLMHDKLVDAGKPGDRVEITRKCQSWVNTELLKRLDIYETLTRSMAPNIWELDDVKKGLLCQTLESGALVLSDRGICYIDEFDKMFVNARSMLLENLNLLHWYGDNVEEVVAKGSVALTDPNTKAHHVPFGQDFWRVCMDLVFDSEAILVRPTDEARTLGGVAGSTIVWTEGCIRLL